MMSPIFLKNSTSSLLEKTSKKKKCFCQKCRAKKFIPVTTPRMPIYSVAKGVWFSDLRNYNDHRERCFYAKPRVDDKPVPYDIKRRLNCERLQDSSFRVRQIDMENKKMINMLITIDRFGGALNTVNSRVYMRKSKRTENASKMLWIDKENELIHERLQAAKSRYVHGLREWEHWKKELANAAKYPIILLKKRDLDKEIRSEPSISLGLSKIKSFSHQCFMDFKVYEGEHLGRIVISLYYYFEPRFVYHFMRICQQSDEQTYKNSLVHRIVKDKYLEAGELTEHSKRSRLTTVSEKAFNHKTNKLRHYKTGTVSMVRDKNLKYNSKFCITFRPMEQLDMKNIVIGNVVKGANVLMKINGYGRKIGKPLAKILVSDCGYLTH